MVERAFYIDLIHNPFLPLIISSTARMNEVDDLKRGVAGGSIMKGVFKVCFFFFSAIFIIIPVP